MVKTETEADSCRLSLMVFWVIPTAASAFLAPAIREKASLPKVTVQMRFTEESGTLTPAVCSAKTGTVETA
jgi:hypothetical protein